MESVPDRVSVLEKNGNGLFDLTIREGAEVITAITNVTLQRAVVEIENNMHTKRRPA